MWGRRVWTRGVVAAVAGVGLAWPLSLPATAAQPEFERTVVDDEFDDEFLSEACGVPVVTTAQGHITDRFFPDDGTGLQFVRSINITLIATSGDNSIRFKDVGGDVVRITPDGTTIVSIIGQLPFDFTGVLKLDGNTGEVIQEPQHFTGDTTRACAMLTA